MIERQPYLPRFMAGGDGNPLGARALYLGDTIYRFTAPISRPPLAPSFPRAASGSPTRTSRTCIPASRLARAWWCCRAGAGNSRDDRGWFVRRDGVPRQAAWLPIEFGSAGKAIHPGEACGRAHARSAEAQRGRRGRRGARACPCVQGPSGRRRIRGVGRQDSPGISRTVSVSRLGAAAELNRCLMTACEHP
jgi:hypothetical protein